MGYWIDMREKARRAIDGSLSSFRGRMDSLVDTTRCELEYLRDRRDLYLKNRELRGVVAALGDSGRDYSARGPIYRKDIRDIMHRVTLIKAECGRIKREMYDLRHRGKPGVRGG